MLIDARQLTSGAVVEADIAIVGAGAAGISPALELSGNGLGCFVSVNHAAFFSPTHGPGQ
jgi:ribulose 1,5-bisphosphate synthetase/thiazole synthase